MDGGLRAPTPYWGGMTQRAFFFICTKTKQPFASCKKKVPHNIIWFDCPSYAVRQLSEVEQLVRGHTAADTPVPGGPSPGLGFCCPEAVP